MNEQDTGTGEDSFKGWLARYSQTPNKYDKNPIRLRTANLTLRPGKQEEAAHPADAAGM